MEWILQTLMMLGAAAASIFIQRDSPTEFRCCTGHDGHPGACVLRAADYLRLPEKIVP